MMRFFVIVLIIGQPYTWIIGQNFVLQNGDLLFQDLDCGELCDAIEAVTPGYKNARFSHIGLVVRDSTGIAIIESIHKGTVITPLDSFFNQSLDKNGNPKVWVGRLKNEYQHVIPIAIAYAKLSIGTPYDHEFLFNNSSLYCSEMIYKAFFDSTKQSYLFNPAPMTFKNDTTNTYFPAWVSYYKKLNIPVPEGKPGINPGLISISDKINIIHQYGKPDGSNQ